MEKFSLMLDQFWAYFDLATTMFSLAIVFMIIANALSFLRRGNETAQMLYAGMILIAAMFSAFGILLPDISHVLVSSSYLAFMLMCCSVCAAFFTAFTKKQSCYIAASVLFYASNILTCILMHC